MIIVICCKGLVIICKEVTLQKETMLLDDAIMAHQEGDFVQASQIYLKILSENPANCDANHNIGILLVQTGEPKHAISFLEAAIQLNPKIYTYWASYINALIKLNMSDVAKQALSIVKIYGFDQEVFNSLSHNLNLKISGRFPSEPPDEVLQDVYDPLHQKNYQLAANIANSLLFEFPNSASLSAISGLINTKMGKTEEAIVLYKRSLFVDWRQSSVHNNLGNLYQLVDEPNLAIKHMDIAIRLDPDNALFLFNRAYFEFLAGQFKNAMYLHDKAIKSAHKSSKLDLVDQFSFNEALISLSNGYIMRGWKAYRKRFKSKNFTSEYLEFDKPRLISISEAKEKIVLVWGEQGIGDELLFLNLVKNFKKVTNAKIIFKIDDRLDSLIARSFTDDVLYKDISSTNDAVMNYHDYDYHLPIGDLPCIINLAKDNKVVSPYLKVKDSLLLKWNESLPNSGYRIGFAWTSSLVTKKRSKNYFDLNKWTNLLETQNCSFINLQYGNLNEITGNLSQFITEKLFTPDIDLKNDFENLSAILANCDLVIAPPTAVIPHAASLGVRTLSYTTEGSPYFLGSIVGLRQTCRHPFLLNNETLIFNNQTRDMVPAKIKKILQDLISRRGGSKAVVKRFVRAC